VETPTVAPQVLPLAHHDLHAELGHDLRSSVAVACRVSLDRGDRAVRTRRSQRAPVRANAWSRGSRSADGARPAPTRACTRRITARARGRPRTSCAASRHAEERAVVIERPLERGRGERAARGAGPRGRPRRIRRVEAHEIAATRRRSRRGSRGGGGVRAGRRCAVSMVHGRSPAGARSARAAQREPRGMQPAHAVTPRRAGRGRAEIHAVHRRRPRVGRRVTGRKHEVPRRR